MKNTIIIFGLACIVSCTSLPPIEDRIDHYEFELGLYQLKATQNDVSIIKDVWENSAMKLCPAGYESFNMHSFNISGGGFANGGPGLLGYAINEGIKHRGAILAGNLLCMDSELTLAEAKKILGL